MCVCVRAPPSVIPLLKFATACYVLSLFLSLPLSSLSRGIRADRVFPFSLTLPVYFFLLSSPWPYVTVDRPSHRNRQHCYTLPRLPVPRSVLEPSTVIQSALRTFPSSRVTSPLSPLSLSPLYLSIYLSLLLATMRAESILSYFPSLSFSPAARSILLPYERSILSVLFSSFAAHAFSTSLLSLALCAFGYPPFSPRSVSSSLCSSNFLPPPAISSHRGNSISRERTRARSHLSFPLFPHSLFTAPPPAPPTPVSSHFSPEFSFSATRA